MTQFSVDPHRLEELLIYTHNFGKQMIEGHGEFFPFGAVIDTSEKMICVGGSNGDEHPPAQEIAKILMESFQRQFSEGSIIAAALAANVNIPGEFNPPYPDGIRTTIECRGFARNIYLPYKMSGGGLLGKLTGRSRKVKYAEMIPVDIDPYLCPTKM